MFSGLGIMTDKLIEEGEFVTYYDGDRVTQLPADDDYVFQIEAFKRLIW